MEPSRTTVSAMLDSAARKRDISAGEHWYQRAQRAGISPEAVTFTPFIDAAAQEGDLQTAEEWLRRALDAGIECGDVAITAVIDAAANSGDLLAAESWFEWACNARVQCSVATFTSLVKAVRTSQDASGAERWYHEARRAGVLPNVVMYSALISAARADVQTAERWFKQAVIDGVQPNIVMYNCLIDVCARSGDDERAETYFSECSARFGVDIVTFGALMNGAASRGDLAAAERWFRLMEQSGIEANVIIWNTLIKACANSRPRGKAQADYAEALFRCMAEQRGLAPDAGTLEILSLILGPKRVEKVCRSVGVDYRSTLQAKARGRERKREGPHFALTAQYRRLSRLSDSFQPGGELEWAERRFPLGDARTFGG